VEVLQRRRRRRRDQGQTAGHLENLQPVPQSRSKASGAAAAAAAVSFHPHVVSTQKEWV
jgi:hypothetical protein